VEMLLRNENLVVNQQTNEGMTALMWASFNGHKEVVQILLEHTSINVNHQNNNGLTALAGAYENKYYEIVKLLLDIDVNQNNIC
jgi:ankyrin repeat protein